MKKYLFWLTALLGSFSMGIGACILFYFNVMPEVPALELTEVPKVVECSDSKNFPGRAREISQIKKVKGAFFPRDLFGNDVSDATSQDRWYGKHLKAMNEKSLIDTSNETKEIYRFLWLRSFDHPIFVRVERHNRYNIELFTKELDGAGGYEPGKSLRTGHFRIYEKDWLVFKDLLEKADYWKMPSEKEVFGPDGAEWILEGVKDSHYHIVERWSPREGAYRDACIFLLKLSEIDVDNLKSDLY